MPGIEAWLAAPNDIDANNPSAMVFSANDLSDFTMLMHQFSVVTSKSGNAIRIAIRMDTFGVAV